MAVRCERHNSTRVLHDKKPIFSVMYTGNFFLKLSAVLKPLLERALTLNPCVLDHNPTLKP